MSAKLEPVWYPTRFRVGFRKMPWPFEALPGAAPLIVHGSHHQCGTAWMLRILRRVENRFGLPLHVGPQAERGEAAIFAQTHSKLDFEALPAFRATHMIRDPRDIVLAGYEYHKAGTDPWTQKPLPEYHGQTYAERLNDVSREAGLATEIDRFAVRDAPGLNAWRSDRDDVLELRMEDVRASPAHWFPKIFTHYGFVPWAVEAATENAVRHTIEKGTGSFQGPLIDPGAWEEVFTPSLKDYMKERTGDLIQRLGYAKDADW